MKIWLLFVVLLMGACHKRSSDQADLVSARVIYSGPLAADGCDWALLVQGERVYHPTNLDARFHQDNLELHIRYKLTGGKFACGFGGTGLAEIQLLEVQP